MLTANVSQYPQEIGGKYSSSQKNNEVIIVMFIIL